MDIYVEREKGISLQEWLNYIKIDNDLVLQEISEGINPITKQKLKINIPGRALLGDIEIVYQNGRIGCDGYSEEGLAKLKEIAKSFNANVYD